DSSAAGDFFVPQKTTLPLCRSVLTSSNPIFDSSARRSAIATMLWPPRFTPRNKAMYRVIRRDYGRLVSSPLLVLRTRRQSRPFPFGGARGREDLRRLLLQGIRDLRPRAPGARVRPRRLTQLSKARRAVACAIHS